MRKVYGQLKDRTERNRERLSAPEYCAPEIFGQGGGWSGDWQGRTILALASLYKTEQDEDRKENILMQLDGILNALDGQTNEDGYFGELFDGDAVNEQQLSGNSWFLRGLCAIYEIRKDVSVYDRLLRISERYLSRLSQAYLRYPTVKREEGGVGGHLQSTVGDGWLLSSDVGCAFILLDGITHVYEITRDERLLPVIRIMIKKFAAIDYVFYNCQTHAVLSGTRGVLRLYKLTGEKELLDLAVRNFRLYTEYGMTLNYANFNWFGKPYWTEPCAIVDSFMIAQQLYAYTGERRYAEFVNRCYLNAFRISQRPNGGAGCETCLDERNDCLKNHFYEAFFCCSMRIAEGFFALYENCVFQRQDALYVIMPFSMDCDDMQLRAAERESGLDVEIMPLRNIPKLYFYIPSHCEVKGTFGKREGDMLVFEDLRERVRFSVEYLPFTERRQNREVHMKGDLVLLCGDRGDERTRTEIHDRFSLPDRNAVESLREYL